MRLGTHSSFFNASGASWMRKVFILPLEGLWATLRGTGQSTNARGKAARSSIDLVASGFGSCFPALLSWENLSSPAAQELQSL